MNYLTRLRNAITIRLIVFIFKIFNFTTCFTYLSREYISIFIIQNFFITIAAMIQDFFQITLGNYRNRYSNTNSILTRDSLHKCITFTLAIIHQFLNASIKIFIWIHNLYLLVINENITSYNINENNIPLPDYQNPIDYDTLFADLTGESVYNFLNFIILFSFLYPVLSNMPDNDSSFDIINGEPINNDKCKTICSICYEKKCDWSLPCKHQFHYNCIKKWHIYHNKNSCPLCRSQIKKLIT